MKANQAKGIDEYIAGYPASVQHQLQTMRAAIQEAAPDAEEAMAYGIPTFKLNGNLVHFGGYKDHIGFYPAPMGIEAFKEETAKYQAGKGTLQFPLNQPLPLDLIGRIVKFRVEKNLAKAKQKSL
jgi:uncharacterized protein YdhG (YjbR/CyaY superfamily)